MRARTWDGHRTFAFEIQTKKHEHNDNTEYWFVLLSPRHAKTIAMIENTYKEQKTTHWFLDLITHNYIFSKDNIEITKEEAHNELVTIIKYEMEKLTQIELF